MDVPRFFGETSGDRPKRVGDYLVGDFIAEGGMGEVHGGVHVEQNVLVAIKFAKRELLATASGVIRFQNEIAAISRLHHPNIVRVFPSTWDGVRPHFAMELLEGSLADPENRRAYASPERALKLVGTLASALHHAHGKAVLHGDLKPSNVLFDLERRPKIVDFGLAGVLDDIGVPRTAVIRGGTAGWQAPEQALGEPVSVATDIFQLGGLLHWLVAGEEKPPAPVDEGEPPKRPWAPTLDCAVESIVRRARARQPESRYRTAAELGDDLERALSNLPLYEEAGRPWRRVVRWAHRHRLLAGMFVTGAFLLVALPFFLSSLFTDAREWIREQNRFAAGAQALAVRNQLEADARTIVRAAEDEHVRSLVGWGDQEVEPPGLAQYQARFDQLFVFDALGWLRVVVPRRAPKNVDHPYAFRDYHRCATELGARVLAGSHPENAVCVSRVIRSTQDKTLNFCLAVPIIENERMTGVLTGATKARDRFGALEMRCGPGQCMTALLGPRDRDDPDAPLPDTLVVLAHPSLKQPLFNPTDPRDERHVDAASVKRICDSLRCSADLQAPFGAPEAAPILLEGFVEPVTHQRSVAALAPVGRTGLIVMVATPDTAFDDIKATLKRRVWLFVGLPVLFAMSLCAGVLYGPGLRRRLSRA